MFFLAVSLPYTLCLFLPTPTDLFYLPTNLLTAHIIRPTVPFQKSIATGTMLLFSFLLPPAGSTINDFLLPTDLPYQCSTLYMIFPQHLLSVAPILTKVLIAFKQSPNANTNTANASSLPRHSSSHHTHRQTPSPPISPLAPIHSTPPPNSNPRDNTLLLYITRTK